MGFSEAIPARSISKEMLMFELPIDNNNIKKASNIVNPNKQDYILTTEDVALGDAIEVVNGVGTRAVYNSSGEIVIAITAGTAGNLIPYTRIGIIEIPTANFEENKRVYLITGTPNLTTNKPNYETTDYIREVGFTISQNQINLGIKPRIKIIN
jgi:hypothetical protein